MGHDTPSSVASGTSASTPDVVRSYNKVRATLSQALAEAGRGEVETDIIVVSKKHDAARIEPLLKAGHRLFGENRVQEAKIKWSPLRGVYSNVQLHLIGPLQSNKARDAVELFDVIQTIDRPKIAQAIAAAVEQTSRRPGLYIQVNTGEEAQKAGIPPAQADEFIAFCQKDCALPITGLMCIPPADEPPSPHFALLDKLAKRHGLPVLSMGMSADYEIAAQLGATYVRVGSDILGPRPS